MLLFLRQCTKVDVWSWTLILMVTMFPESHQDNFMGKNLQIFSNIRSQLTGDVGDTTDHSPGQNRIGSLAWNDKIKDIFRY